MQNKCSYCGAFLSKKAILELNECEYCGKSLNSNNFRSRFFRQKSFWIKLKNKNSFELQKYLISKNHLKKFIDSLDNPTLLKIKLIIGDAFSKSKRKKNIRIILISPILIILIFFGKSIIEDIFFKKGEIEILEKERKERNLLIKNAKQLTRNALPLFSFSFNDVGNLIAKKYIDGNCNAFKITGSYLYGSPHHMKVDDSSSITKNNLNREEMINWIESSNALYSDKEKNKKAGAFLYFMVRSKFLDACPNQIPLNEIKSIIKLAEEIILISPKK